MTSSHHAPYAQGCKHATMAGTEGCDPARVSESHKAGLSSDCRLQLACMKPELLVIPDQHAGVNTFPGLVHTAVTPRKSVTPEAGGPTRKRGSRLRWDR